MRVNGNNGGVRRPSPPRNLTGRSGGAPNSPSPLRAPLGSPRGTLPLPRTERPYP